MKDQQIHPEDQISLSGFTNTVRAFFRLCFQLLDLLISAVVKGKYIILLALALGCVFGFYKYSKSAYQYKGTMLLRFNTLSPRTYGEILDQLNQLAATGSVQQLSDALKISSATASKIISIDSRTLYNQILSDTNSQVRDRVFKLTLTMQQEQSSADSLEQAFLQYLNSLPFVSASRQKEMQIQTDKLNYVTKELRKMDSSNLLLSSVQAYTRNPQSTNPTGFYIQYLLQEKENAQRQLAFEATAVAKVEGFRFVRVPGEFSAFKTVMKFAIVGLLLGILVAFLVHIRRNLMTS